MLRRAEYLPPTGAKLATLLLIAFGRFLIRRRLFLLRRGFVHLQPVAQEEDDAVGEIEEGSSPLLKGCKVLDEARPGAHAVPLLEELSLIQI